MKNIIYILLVCCLLLTGWMSANIQDNYKLAKNETTAGKKKLLIFTSKGGNGHMNGTAALKEMLGDQYDIQVVNPFETIFRSLDIVRKLSFGKSDWESLYNKLYQKGMTNVNNFMCKKFGPWLERSNREEFERRLHILLEQEKPDLVISIIPLINLAAGNATNKLSIPFIVVTQDGNLKLWSLGLENLKHENYAITIGMNTPTTREYLEKQGISHNNIHTIGFPLRQPFFQNKHKKVKEIRQEWNIPQDKFTVMMMMGGPGGRQLIKFTEEILRNNLDVHLLICCGRNEKIKNNLESLLSKKQDITFTLVPFTNKVADLMAASDLLLTKPGPNTIAEAVQSYLPIVVDASMTTLFWERANIKYVTENNYGETLTSLKNLAPIIREYMHKRKTQPKETYHAYNQFNQEIVKLIANMLEKKALQTAQPLSDKQATKLAKQ
ncbi:MAG: CDP-glycerol glycerophosphotransferase family protein [Epsilonproteobacteria bacterium]|nr:CDP-glycerol glycerophosphotransferase family protein [Campylobacterota bacterium]